MPLQEISQAKQNLQKAQDYKADKYSKNEYDLSSKNFLEAHNFSFNPNKDEKKVLEFAQKSLTNSKLAIEKSLPSYLNDLQAEAISSKNSAIESGAETLSSDFFEQGNLFLSEADELSNPQTDSERINRSIQKYKDSIEAYEKSRELSLSQANGILASSSDIETDLDQIEKYSGTDKVHKNKISSLRNQYKEASQNLEDGKVKIALQSLEKIRLESSNLKSEVLLPFAKEKVNLANESILNTEKKMAAKDFPIIAENSDNFAASKEAYSSAIDLITKERYYDSIQQSDESIKLSKSIVSDKNLLANAKSTKSERNSDKKDKSSTNTKVDSADKKDESLVSEASSNNEDSKLNSKTKYKKYVVQKKNPPETLWMIAQDKKNLGNKNLWKNIYKANKKSIKDPDKIFPNQVILIPQK